MKTTIRAALSLAVAFCVVPVGSRASNPVLSLYDVGPINEPIDLCYSWSSGGVVFMSGNAAPNNGPSGFPYNLYSVPYWWPADFKNYLSPVTSVSGVGNSGLGNELGLTSALLGAGFNLGDLFVGNPDTKYVMRLNPDGSVANSAWWTDPYLSTLNDCGLYFDSALSVGVGRRLFLATEAGDMFKINGDGTSVRLLSPAALSTGFAQFTAVVTVTNDPIIFGPMAGKAIACDSQYSLLYIVDPSAINNYYSVSLNWLNTDDNSVIHIAAHALLPIAGYDNPVRDLWFADWNAGRIRRLNHFGSQVPVGSFLIITEHATNPYYNLNGQGLSRHWTHFWTMRYNPQTYKIEVEPLIVQAAPNAEFTSLWLEGATWVPH